MHVTMLAMTKTITAISTKGYVIVCQDMPKTQMVTADVLKVSAVQYFCNFCRREQIIKGTKLLHLSFFVNNGEEAPTFHVTTHKYTHNLFIYSTF